MYIDDNKDVTTINKLIVIRRDFKHQLL